MSRAGADPSFETVGWVGGAATGFVRLIDQTLLPTEFVQIDCRGVPGVWEAIRKLKEEGLSILLVEQNANLALKLVDYVHVMSKGQVVYSAKPEELRANEQIKSSYLGI